MGSKLDPHAAYLLGLIADKVDLTLEELPARLARERGVRAAIGTLWHFYHKQGMTFKKRLGMRKSTPGQTWRNTLETQHSNNPASTTTCRWPNSGKVLP